MATATLEEIQQDQLVMSVAKALAMANGAVVSKGVNPADLLISISEESSTSGRVWRVHYGPRDFVNRRGGDLIVLVDEHSGSVQVTRGQ